MKWYEKLEKDLKARNAHVDFTQPPSKWIKELKPTSINFVMCEDVKKILNSYFHGMTRSTDVPESWLMGFLEIMHEVKLILEYYNEGKEDEANRMRRLKMTYDSCLISRDITDDWIERQRWVC